MGAYRYWLSHVPAAAAVRHHRQTAGLRIQKLNARRRLSSSSRAGGVSRASAGRWISDRFAVGV